jgi:hypothetical protein
MAFYDDKNRSKEQRDLIKLMETVRSGRPGARRAEPEPCVNVSVCGKMSIQA